MLTPDEHCTEHLYNNFLKWLRRTRSAYSRALAGGVGRASTRAERDVLREEHQVDNEHLSNSEIYNLGYHDALDEAYRKLGSDCESN